MEDRTDALQAPSYLFSPQTAMVVVTVHQVPGPMVAFGENDVAFQVGRRNNAAGCKIGRCLDHSIDDQPALRRNDRGLVSAQSILPTIISASLR
jgi:hypothetical protein